MSNLIYNFGLQNHSIFIEKNTNKVYSFGYNQNGQLGLGDTSNRNVPTEITEPLDGNIVQIYLGGNHSLILTDANKVYSFGYNYYGGLGLGDTTDRNVPTEITTSLDGNPIQVQQGRFHSFIITDINKIYSFGYNNNGQLGLGDTSNRNIPTEITTFLDGNPIQVQQGFYHSFILTDTNKVYSFGDNNYGQLGLGDTTDRNVPTEITTSLDGNPIQVQQGFYHSFILTDTNKVYSFGYNNNGGLGLGDTSNRNVPTEITTSLDGNPIQVYLGGNHSLILTDTNKVYSFGRNSNDQLGLGDTTDRNIPTEITTSLDGNPIHIQQGYLNSLILTDTNKVYSFGDNNYGQLGLGDTSNRTIPTLIENFDVFIGIKLLLLLYKNNNFYYENSDTSNIELIGSNISKEDFDNYGSGNFLNIQDIIKNGYSILYFDEKQTNSSNINSELTFIPNNQLIKMQDYIYTQNFQNIDKITLNQSNLNLLNNEIKNLNTLSDFQNQNYGLDNNLNLIYNTNFNQNDSIQLDQNNYMHTFNLNEILNKYNTITNKNVI